MSHDAAENKETSPLILQADEARAVFDPDGARMTSLQFGGHELLRTEDTREDVWFGAFIMAPWAGLLRDGRLSHDDVEYALPLNWGGHSLHGIARFAEFDETAGVLTAALPPLWPLGGLITITPILHSDELQIRFTVTAGEFAMPASIGWHPWFARSLGGSEAIVLLPDDAERLERGDDGLPTGGWVTPGDGPWDDCFRTGKPVVIRWPGVGTLTVSSSGGFVGVFDGEATGIAVEPMTAPVETLPHLLHAGESHSLEVTLRWSTS